MPGCRNPGSPGRGALSIAILIPLLILEVPDVQATELFVAPDGSDSNPGTRAAPFATPAAARDALRARRAAGAVPGPAIVNLRGGTYRITETLLLEEEDSGTGEAPVVWQAEPGTGEVRFVGGVRLSEWRQVADRGMLDRLRPEARAHVLQTDLRAAGAADLGMPAPVGAPRAELICNARYMPLARYPTRDWLKVSAIPEGGTLVETQRDSHYGRFAYDDDRPAGWADTGDLWVHGYWVHDWRDEYHRVEELDLEKREIRPQKPYHQYGYRKGQRFYFLNVLEELDEPGEWYLDRGSGILYFWPPADLAGAEIFFPQLAEPMLVMQETRHVLVRRITFEAAWDKAVVIESGSDNEIAGCTIRNFGAAIAVVIRGTRNGIRSSDLYEVAGAGIELGGGDRTNLTPGRNWAVNNDIHRTGRVYRTYHGAFRLNGVGNRIAHCWIHDLPHQGIGYKGNDHVIEYCEFERIALETGDVGATYTGADWTFMGHEFRYNYFHDIHGPGRLGCYTVYPDLPCGGIHLHHNIFYDVDQVFHTNSGRAMVIENNIFLRADLALSFKVWKDSSMFMEEGPWRMVENLQAARYDQPPYITRYPTLRKLAADFRLGPEQILQRQLPKDNVIRRNVSRTGLFLRLGAEASLDHVRVEGNLIADAEVFHGSFDGSGERVLYRNDDAEAAARLGARGNVILDGDPGFGGLETQDFRLAADSPAWDLGFEPIPFHEIGLRVDEYRESLPPRAAAPLITPGSQVFSNEVTVRLTPSPLPGGPQSVLRYTLDGTDPTAASPVYSGQLRIDPRRHRQGGLVPRRSAVGGGRRNLRAHRPRRRGGVPERPRRAGGRGVSRLLGAGPELPRRTDPPGGQGVSQGTARASAGGRRRRPRLGPLRPGGGPGKCDDLHRPHRHRRRDGELGPRLEHLHRRDTAPRRLGAGVRERQARRGRSAATDQRRHLRGQAAEADHDRRRRRHLLRPRRLGVGGVALNGRNRTGTGLDPSIREAASQAGPGLAAGRTGSGLALESKKPLRRKVRSRHQAGRTGFCTTHSQEILK